MLKLSMRLALGVTFCAAVLNLCAAESGDLPAETRWVLSLDLHAIQKSALASSLLKQFEAGRREKAERQIAGFNAMFGIDLLKDIRRVTLAGSGSTDKGGVAYIEADLDEQRFTTVLAMAKQYTSSDHGGVAVQSWFDDNDKKTKFVTFAKPGLVLLSDTKEPMLSALDAIAKRKPGLAPDSLLGGVLNAKNTILTLGAHKLTTLIGAQPQVAAFKQADSLTLSLTTPDDKTLAAKAAINTLNDETAQQIHQALIGIQALTMLRAAKDPETANIANQASIGRDGRKVGLSLSLSEETLAGLLRKYVKPDGAGKAPAEE